METETLKEHYQPFKMERFAKRIMSECTCATRNFSGQGRGGEDGVTRAFR